MFQLKQIKMMRLQGSFQSANERKIKCARAKEFKITPEYMQFVK